MKNKNYIERKGKEGFSNKNLPYPSIQKILKDLSISEKLLFMLFLQQDKIENINKVNNNILFLSSPCVYHTFSNLEKNGIVKKYKKGKKVVLEVTDDGKDVLEYIRSTLRHKIFK